MKQEDLGGIPTPQPGTTLAVKRFLIPPANSPGEPVVMELPKGAQIMKVIGQSDPLAGVALFLWALVDPYVKLTEWRTVITAGTGHHLAAEAFKGVTWDFTDTISVMGGRMLVHVWISKPSLVVVA